MLSGVVAAKLMCVCVFPAARSLQGRYCRVHVCVCSQRRGRCRVGMLSGVVAAELMCVCACVPSGGGRMLEMLRWWPDAGDAPVVAGCWRCSGGDRMLEMLQWPDAGDAPVVAGCLRCTGG